MGGWMGSRRTFRWLAFVAVLAWGCGDDGLGPDPAVAQFVGQWAATKLVLTSVANPEIAPDIIALGAQFNLDVQPSGQYTAILIYSGQAGTEIGTITVSGNTITLHRDFPTPSTTTAVYQLSGNLLTLDGDTEFDFNLDGTSEAARAHFELIRS